MTALYETIVIVPCNLNDGHTITLKARKDFQEFLN